MKKTLKMIFGLDSGKKSTVSLADPRADLDRDDVEPVMQMVIDKQAQVIGEASPTSIDAAVIVEVNETKLI